MSAVVAARLMGGAGDTGRRTGSKSPRLTPGMADVKIESGTPSPRTKLSTLASTPPKTASAPVPTAEMHPVVGIKVEPSEDSISQETRTEVEENAKRKAEDGEEEAAVEAKRVKLEPGVNHEDNAQSTIAEGEVSLAQ